MAMRARTFNAHSNAKPPPCSALHFFVSQFCKFEFASVTTFSTRKGLHMRFVRSHTTQLEAMQKPKHMDAKGILKKQTETAFERNSSVLTCAFEGSGSML